MRCISSELNPEALVRKFRLNLSASAVTCVCCRIHFYSLLVHNVQIRSSTQRVCVEYNLQMKVLVRTQLARLNMPRHALVTVGKHVEKPIKLYATFVWCSSLASCHVQTRLVAQRRQHFKFLTALNDMLILQEWESARWKEFAIWTIWSRE